MTFGYGAFALGAALLYSAFQNSSLIDVILGRKGESISAQGESHPSSETVASSPSGSAAKGPAVAPAGVDKRLKVPTKVPKHIASALAKGAAKITWMSGRFPYSWGGGHEAACKAGGRGENGGPGFDCSGCWSCVLIVMGIITAPMTSGQMAGAFEPGPGKYITLWANNVHVFGRFLGVAFATGSGKEAKRGGPAIGNSDNGSKGEYTECHPKGW